MYPQPASPAKDLSHIVVLILLVFALWFALVFTGTIRCSTFPGGCELYWGLIRMNNNGQPKILIVYGDGGDGDYELLQQTLGDPAILRVRTQTLHLERVTLNTLKDYDLVIVEEAKKMSTDKLKMFIDYALQGGRLIWTGDAGTELASDDKGELLTYGELYSSDTNTARGKQTISGWARKKGDDPILMNSLLGLDYNANFCEVMSCLKKDEPVGLLLPEPEIEHKLIYGISPNLKMNGDFSIVNPKSDIATRIVLSVDFGSVLITKGKQKIPKTSPLIVTSGVGERVVYYAVPPEQFVNPERKMDYVHLVEQLYEGMLK